jgi:hypothetical protein
VKEIWSSSAQHKGFPLTSVRYTRQPLFLKFHFFWLHYFRFKLSWSSSQTDGLWRRQCNLFLGFLCLLKMNFYKVIILFFVLIIQYVFANTKEAEQKRSSDLSKFNLIRKNLNCMYSTHIIFISCWNQQLFDFKCERDSYKI